MMWKSLPYSIVVLTKILVAFIISDYMSLFVVRKCLQIGTNYYQIVSLVFGVIAGICVVIISQFIIVFLLNDIFSSLIRHYSLLKAFKIDLFVFSPYFRHPFMFLIQICPAFLAHIWLPLFAVGALVVRLTGLAQWLQGDEHPLDAIGMASAVVVFAVTVILKLLAPVI